MLWVRTESLEFSEMGQSFFLKRWRRHCRYPCRGSGEPPLRWRALCLFRRVQ